jgi:hypothetical protein
MPEGFQAFEKGKQFEKILLKRIFVTPDLNSPNMSCPLLECVNEAPIEWLKAPAVEK